MKNFIKSVKMFGAWAIIAAVATACIFIGFGSYKFCSAIIVSTFLLMPMRNWTVRIIIWLIDFLSSNMQGFKDAITPWATMNTLIDEKNRTENVGFYRTIKVAVAAFYVFLALICWVFQEMSASFVYGFIHNVVTVVTNLGSEGWERASVLIWLLLMVATIAVIVWFVSLYIRGENVENRDIIIAIVAFIIQRIATYICLEYSWNMIWSNILFWVIILVIPILFIGWILPRILPYVKKIFH